MNFDHYDTGGFYDEMFKGPAAPRPGGDLLRSRIDSLGPGELVRRQRAAERALLQMGITFNVYGDEGGTERIWPFDLIPRIIDTPTWEHIDAGLRQRITALNAFIDDIYGDQRILREGVVPEDLIKSSTTYREACRGLKPPGGIWCHITGTDLVRDADGTVYVLEDNLRCPSGVSYVLENRQIMKQSFPSVFGQLNVKPVNDYPFQLLDMLQGLAPSHLDARRVAVLTPGFQNSAYYEHSYLAQQMGVPLVEGQDLVIVDGYVHMRTTHGIQRVDVIYRRIDDDFLDPNVFRDDSMLGVPGLMEAYREGRVAIANAPGTGIADDKVIYTYVPDIIRFYMKQEPLIPNVPTYLCSRDADRQHVLANLDKLVVKTADGAGGYGMLMGPTASQAERDAFAELIKAKPRMYIAQRMLSLSRVPVIAGDRFEGRHVDLRPFILYGSEGIYVLPGGLTRVALRKGSMVVNSSQGGGSKDTWVIQPDGDDRTMPMAAGMTKEAR